MISEGELIAEREVDQNQKVDKLLKHYLNQFLINLEVILG